MAKKLSALDEALGVEEKKETRGRKAAPDKSQNKSAQTTILLRPATKENLRELAWRRRTSLNELINQMCEEYLEKHRKELEKL